MIRYIGSKIVSTVSAVITDFAIGRAINRLPTGLLMSSVLALLFRHMDIWTFGHNVFNIFIQWSSRSSIFSRIIEHTLSLM